MRKRFNFKTYAAARAKITELFGKTAVGGNPQINEVHWIDSLKVARLTLYDDDASKMTFRVTLL